MRFLAGGNVVAAKKMLMAKTRDRKIEINQTERTFKTLIFKWLSTVFICISRKALNFHSKTCGGAIGICPDASICSDGPCELKIESVRVSRTGPSQYHAGTS